MESLINASSEPYTNLFQDTPMSTVMSGSVPPLSLPTSPPPLKAHPKTILNDNLLAASGHQTLWIGGSVSTYTNHVTSGCGVQSIYQPSSGPVRCLPSTTKGEEMMQGRHGWARRMRLAKVMRERERERERERGREKESKRQGESKWEKERKRERKMEIERGRSMRLERNSKVQ